MSHNHRTDKENKSKNVNLKGIVEKLLTPKRTHIANELVLRKTRPTFTKPLIFHLFGIIGVVVITIAEATKYFIWTGQLVVRQ